MATAILGQGRDILRINEELKILRANFLYQLKEHNLSLNLNHDKLIFRASNWIICFPFNFKFGTNSASLGTIRKFAVINALYGLYFLTEDHVFDEYHLPKQKYRRILLRLCEVHTSRNLAIGQLLNMVGPQIYEYIFDFERKYYRALYAEKSVFNRSGQTKLEQSDLNMLGEKALPICIPFAAFCQKYNCMNKLALCVDLVKNYHVAHQLYDDLYDLTSDGQKPDRSWLINLISAQNNGRSRNTADYRAGFTEAVGRLQIHEHIVQHLSMAEQIATRLKFPFFLDHINQLRNLINTYFNCNDLFKTMKT